MDETDVVDDPTMALEGYAFGATIGRGGIGEVVLARDLRFGRDVAIKRLRAASPTEDEVARFLREARIQARLDHPAVPPVYELGQDKQGRPYFTMKRLAGATLQDVLARPQPNRAQLLRTFHDVCLAIELAHARGVVHRDLKPSNIMIGEFGEVYVLDWGLSRVVGEAAAELAIDDDDTGDGHSDLLGTPGYMAPEQLQHMAEAGRPADVYALGAILFELLAGEALHPRADPRVASASTLDAATVIAPGKRRPDRAVPPELDALCASMLEADPIARPTAKRVAARVQGYLDGDRDVAHRRELALDLMWSARAAHHDGRRAEAIRAAGRALALDPDSTEPAELVTALILEPPAEPPPELARALREADADAVSRHARTAVGSYLALAAFLPIAAWNGIRRWDLVLSVTVTATILALSAWRIHVRPLRTTAQMIAYALGNALLLALMARMAGPFTFVPGISCVIAMSVMAYPTFIARSGLLIAILVGGFAVSVGLELAGALPATWELRDGMLISHAGALELGGVPTVSLLIGASIATIVIAGVHASRIYRGWRGAQSQLVTQAWHLRQLLPSAPLAGASYRAPKL